MKHNFRGWTTVFGFTFRQTVKGLAFKLTTILVGVLIIAAIIAVTIFSAKPEKKDQLEASPIKTIYVLDESGLQPTDYKASFQAMSLEQFLNIDFVNVTDQTREEVIQAAAKQSTEAIAVIISKNEKGYSVEAVVPSGSTIKKDQAQKVLDPIKSSFESNKLMQSGLSVELLSIVKMPVSTNYTNVGESSSLAVTLIKMIAPMLFALILYMMLILYGQTISKSVSTEKTSKLMETLLTSIHPYALITGKVLAVTLMAVLQFTIWITAAIVGLFAGNTIAHELYPEYKSTVVAAFQFLKDNISETALSLPAVILALLVFIMAFLFYCVLASLAGSMVAKPEDVASTQSIFMLPIVISWLVCYVAAASENEAVLKIARLVPFTAPFCVPVDLITGTIGLVEGLISFSLLAIFSALVILLSARIYKGLILYTGQKLNLKMLGNVLRSSK